MILWKMAWKNLGRNKRRTLATASAFIAGFVGLNLLGGYILRTERFLKVNSIYNNRSGHISLYKKDSYSNYALNPKKYLITAGEQEKIAAILKEMPEVEFSAPLLHGMGLLSNGEKSVPFLGLGIEPRLEKKIQEHEQIQRWTWELVPPPSEKVLKDAAENEQDSISVTKQLAALVGRTPPFADLTAEQREVFLAATSVFNSFNAVNGEIRFRHQTGLALTEDTSLIAPLQLFQRLFETEGGVSSLSIFLKPDSSVSKAIDVLGQKLESSGLDMDLYPFSDERISLFYVGTMGFLYIMAGFFVFLIFTAVVLSIVNSSTIAILERLKEIASLKSIGFPDDEVARMFTRESLLLTSCCFMAGLVLTQLMAMIVNALNIRFYPPGISGDMQFLLTPDLWLCSVIGIPLIGISILCSHIVSRRIVRKSIISLMVST